VFELQEISSASTDRRAIAITARSFHEVKTMRRILILTAITAAVLAGQSVRAQDQQADASKFAGSEACATCHDEQAKKFETNPHTRLALLHEGKGVTCESCHGPGKAHSEDGGATKVFSFTTATPKEADAICLNCHSGQHPNFDRSQHAKANVGCTSCHSVHGSKDTEQLLKADQPQLCFQCHTDVKPAFDMPFHHKVNEGLVKCSDCHDTHGTMNRTNLRSTADQNAVCTKCHTETRGPFVFEHPVVKAEGCVGCHTPHGSQNARLLNMPSINTLCNQCHSPVSAATVHSVGVGTNTLAPCISCHSAIHGSNLNGAFFR
jgi:DmsE family decaheme c-type cytochrome